MTGPGVFPVRTSSLPLFIIFLLLNSLLNRLHSPSHESGNIGKILENIRAPVSVLEPKFSLHKWDHGYTCSYRWFWLHSWIYIQEYINIDHACFRDPRPICSECLVRPQLWQCVGRTRLVFASWWLPCLVVWWFLVLVLVISLFRTWGIVLVDLRPASLRAAVALRLA